MLESTTGRNTYYGMYSELQVKLTGLHIKLILNFPVFPSIIRSSMTAVAASGFTFVSWWQSCCVRGRAGWAENIDVWCLILDGKVNYSSVQNGAVI